MKVVFSPCEDYPTNPRKTSNTKQDLRSTVHIHPEVTTGSLELKKVVAGGLDSYRHSLHGHHIFPKKRQSVGVAA